jgi:hypothetical protein
LGEALVALKAQLLVQVYLVALAVAVVAAYQGQEPVVLIHLHKVLLVEMGLM